MSRETGTTGATTEKGGASLEHTKENSRWRCFTRDYIRDTKGDSLDISWLKDKDSIDAADLPEPDVLAAEAMFELTEALQGLEQLVQTLAGTNEKSAGTR